MSPRVHLYTLCWDEADMLGFFFRHYDPWVDRYVVFDDGSTDGSRERLAAHPKVELRSFTRSDAASFCLSHQVLQNEVWKESRGRADWVVVTAIDEHLHVRGTSMARYLATQAKQGVTILPALGFDMNHPTMPTDDGLLVERVMRGRPRIAFNKLSIFNPDAVRETGFGTGRHRATPIGDLVLPSRDEVMLWHYKHLGFERNAEREATQAARLGPADLANNLGQHYLWSKEKLRSFWKQMDRETLDLSHDSFVPDRACVGPLWWSDRAELKRASAGSEPRVEQRPTVSVLIKSFNHAPYVAQTIESVLAQSFQDFEIVVTDDASTDATAAIMRHFDDRRIDLVVNERNLGISGAMNASLARARGRYLAIVNSDDWMFPDRLRRQVEFLDTNPHAGVVATLPRCVDERGAATAPIEHFKVPFSLADFSRRTWLRHFLFHGNCICAPTTMIRREAFEVGLYDRRLTNLQDLDMWIRMLMSGHTIHVIDDELTAFRIRDGKANMSAVRLDSLMRHHFEMTRVLRHYALLDARDFGSLFGEEAEGTESLPVKHRLALLAVQNADPSHQLFALEALHDVAADDDAFDQLRALTGQCDVFGLALRADLDREDEPPPVSAREAASVERRGLLRRLVAAIS